MVDALALEADLCGSRKVATAAAEKELLTLASYSNRNAHKQQLSHVNIVMHAICKATERSDHNMDIFWDIVKRLLALRPQPTASANHWSRFLHYLLYFQNTPLLQKAMYKEASQIIAYLDAEPDKLQTEGDYKFLLSMYAGFLIKAAIATTATTTSKSSASTYAHYIAQALNALATLFGIMQRQNAALNFQYPQLISDFRQALMTKKPAALIFQLHATQLPATPKIAMYEAFFSLLAVQRQASLSADEVCSIGLQHIEALTVFLQADVQNRLRQPQTALRHLRVLRDAPLLRDDTGMSYTLTLCYFYVKLVWSTSASLQRFTQTYIEVCGKFVSFFRKSSTALVEQPWFLDTLVMLNVLQTQMMLPPGRAAIAAGSTLTLSSSPLSPFDVFWSQMSADCYAAHFELVVSCMQLAPHISDTKLVAWPCCTSIRKHVILNFAKSALSAYSIFVLTCEEEQVNDKSFNALNEHFKLVLRHALNTLSQMTCITPNSPELQSFYARFIQLTRDIRTPRQARFCLTLAEQLPKVQNKFSAAQWRQLLRRIYQTAALSGDHQLSAELQSHYIATELQSHFHADGTLHGDFTLVRKQIATFYVAPPPTVPPHNKCLLELHEASRSVLKPKLHPLQKRLLYWLDAQYVFRYTKLATPALQTSLQQCAPTEYEFILVVRAATSKQQTSSSSSLPVEKLREHCRTLLQKSTPLKRLEQLCHAHASTLLLHEHNDAQKKLRAALLENTETRSTSDYFGELLEHEELQKSVSIVAEMQLVKLAVEAQQAFADFFNKADEEPINSDDAYIDWEFIVEDLAALANFFDYSGYLEYANQTWLLYYRITSTILDDYSALRALAFLCEHVEHHINPNKNQNNHNNNNDIANTYFDLNAEVAGRLPHIVHMLEALLTLRDRHQSWLLCCCAQLAYFYAYSGNYTNAEMLVHMVQHEQQQLSARCGKFDMVLATLEVVQFRILWKQQQQQQQQQQSSEILLPPLLQGYVMRAGEQTLNKFQHFVSVSSSDQIGFMILIFNFIQQLTECLANRLCDHFSEGFLLSIFRMAVNAGASLRIVQFMTMHMLVHVQMEDIDKAQSKLKIIEFIMGTKSLAKLKKSNAIVSSLTMKEQQSSMEQHNAMESAGVSEALSMQLNPSMETMRRMVQVHLSPIKMDKMRISPSARYCDLKRFLRWQPTNTTNEILSAVNEMLQWTNFTIGCITARIYFLAEEYDPLEDFYEKCIKWWQQQCRTKNAFLVRTFSNFKLLSMQHYANYLRANKKYEKALRCLEHSLEESVTLAGIVDTVYGVNMQLQLRNAKAEFQKENLVVAVATKSLKHAKPMRRALEFETPARINKQQQGAVTKPKYVSQKVPIIVYNSENDKKSHRNLHKSEVTQQQQQPLANSLKKEDALVKKPLFDLDVDQIIDLVEFDESGNAPLPAAVAPVNEILASNRKTTTYKTPASQFSITDLVNACESAQKSKIVAIAKRRHSPSPVTDLNDKMKAMNIVANSKIKAPTVRRKLARAQSVVIVEDSPDVPQLSKIKPPKSRNNTDEALAVASKPTTSTSAASVNAVRRGRPRKAATENLENIPQPTAVLKRTTSSSAVATASSRRRQKI